MTEVKAPTSAAATAAEAKAEAKDVAQVAGEVAKAAEQVGEKAVVDVAKAVQEQASKTAKLSPQEIQGMSESTAHALLEGVRALNAKLENSAKGSGFWDGLFRGIF